MPSNPSATQRLANQTTHPFCSCLLTGRNLNGKHPASGHFKAGQTNRILHCKTVLNTLTGRCSGLPLMTTSRFTRTQLRVSSGSVLKMWCRQKQFASTPTKNPRLIALFEQPCQLEPLLLKQEIWKNKNKPTMTSGKPLKPPNDKTKIK